MKHFFRPGSRLGERLSLLFSCLDDRSKSLGSGADLNLYWDVEDFTWTKVRERVPHDGDPDRRIAEELRTR